VKKMEKTTKMLFLVLVLCSIIFFVGITLPFLPTGDADTYNSTAYLNVTVNITNSAPEVHGIVVDTPITLSAMSNVTITCNATVFDWDNNFFIVNATFYNQNSAHSNSQDDKNNHYSNASCVNISSQAMEKNYTCTFTLDYYANNGTWYCNVTAYDFFNATGDNRSNAAIVNPLIAIYVPGTLDFGGLAMGNISEFPALANITNVGNRNISLNVSSWARFRYDDNAMNCSYGNIPFGYQRFNISNGVNWTYATNATNESRRINGLTVFHRLDDISDEASKNSTYWKLKIPAGAAGKCTGTILFEAIDTGI